MQSIASCSRGRSYIGFEDWGGPQLTKHFRAEMSWVIGVPFSIGRGRYTRLSSENVDFFRFLK